ncbi:MAG: hypothetical protein GKR89_11605 [Candidatus Latescibacteria bacterium]|nr:hypothetical protein [Candidatus Latescibacterota bacterium]
MAEEDHSTPADDAFRRQVMREIASLREELSQVKAASRGNRFPNAVLDGYRELPTNVDRPIRWGFIGSWGKAGLHCDVDILTTSEEAFFGHPDATDEKVAAFARAFSNPHTVRLAKYLFHHNGSRREQLLRDCKLSDDELETALRPLIEGHFVQWEEDRLIKTSHHYILTLMSMTRTSNDPDHWRKRWPLAE